MFPTVLQDYQLHATERQKQGIPPLPLSAAQAVSLSDIVFDPPAGKKELLLGLLRDRVPPGVDPAAL